MKPYYDSGGITIYHGDCREILPLIPDKSIDLVLTDPPYPNVHVEEYHYDQGTLGLLWTFSCRQYIFWTARYPFPLTYTAQHIWDKKNGGNCQYEIIYERNGQRRYKVYRHYLINSTVAASFTGDVFNEHPSQKPIKLMRELVIDGKGQMILDPFMGSGTTVMAAKHLNRKCIGIEIEEKYCQIAVERLRQSVMKLGV